MVLEGERGMLRPSRRPAPANPPRRPAVPAIHAPRRHRRRRVRWASLLTRLWTLSPSSGLAKERSLRSYLLLGPAFSHRRRQRDLQSLLAKGFEQTLDGAASHDFAAKLFVHPGRDENDRD